MTTTKKPQYEKFKVRKKLTIVETLLWSLESIIYVLGGFFSGYKFNETHNIIYLGLLVGILVVRFQWVRIVEITKKVKL